MATNHTTLDAIARQVARCSKCPLYQGRTHAVPGEGSATADVMFVGEGPGKKEDEQGRPFVGAAGKFLDHMLSAVGWSREDVFIGNLVKCRPPDNRDPELSEIDTCTRYYLFKQIEIIQPQLIVPLGRHAMHLFLPGDFKISQVHGRVFRRNGQHFMPQYHPAVALYAGSMREVLLKDFKKIPKTLSTIGNTAKK